MPSPPQNPKPLQQPALQQSAMRRPALWRRALRTLLRLARLAWRNLWRNRVRSLITVAAMVSGLTLMITMGAMMEWMVRSMTGFATDISLSKAQLHRQDFIDNQELYALLPHGLVAHVAREAALPVAPRVYAAGLASSGDLSTGVLIKGVEPTLEPKVTKLHQRMRLGTFDLGTPLQRPMENAEGTLTVYPALVGHNLAKNLKLELGSELVLITQALDGSIGHGLFQVRGVMQPLDPAFDRMGVLLSLQAVNELMALTEGVHELAVAAPDNLPLSTLKARLTGAVESWPGNGDLEQSYGGKVQVRTWEEINPQLAGMVSTSAAVMLIGAGIFFSVAALGLVNTMLMALYERRRELGTLLALGMGRTALMAMVMLEAFFLSLVSAVVGSVTGSAMAYYFQVVGWDFSSYLPDGLDYMGVIIDPIYRAHLLPEHIFYSVAVMVALSLLAALYPSWRTIRLKPALVMHQ